ncbi:MAG: AAA family ATPase [Melioribacteraceae bacterium]
MDKINQNQMEKQNNSILQKLRDFIERKDISINKIAKQIGYSAAVVSTYLQGKYPGDIQKLEWAIAAYLMRQEEIEAMPKESIPFCPISNADMVFTIARTCHNEQEIGVLIGEAGTGKTKAAKEYARQNPDVIFIEADLSFTTKVFFKELHRKLGLDGNGGIYDLFIDCVEKLKDSNRLIIIDEAENLPYRALDMIRRLYDKANIGILLIGLPRLIANLRGKRGEFKQLYSRVGIVMQLEDFNENDTKLIVQTIFPNTNGVYKTFHELAKGNGRKLEKLILRTNRVAKSGKKEITERLVKTASEMLLL